MIVSNDIENHLEKNAPGATSYLQIIFNKGKEVGCHGVVMYNGFKVFIHTKNPSLLFPLKSTMYKTYKAAGDTRVYANIYPEEKDFLEEMTTFLLLKGATVERKTGEA